MIMIGHWFKHTKELGDFVKRLSVIDDFTKVCPATRLEKIE